MSPEMEILHHRQLYEKVILGSVLSATRYVWIATANLKDMHVEQGRGYRPILEVFDELGRRGVRFRVVHADLPSRPFRDTLERLPRLSGHALELQVCPRSHWKMVVVDGREAYFGSANFTGAGLGVKSPRRRNLEVGAFTKDPSVVAKLEESFDAFWMGDHCKDCAFRDRCPDPITS